MLRHHGHRSAGLLRPVHFRATDEETGSDPVSFNTGGDGTYPVWLGRSDTGELVAVAVVTS